jgi:hypothetical protein
MRADERGASVCSMIPGQPIRDTVTSGAKGDRHHRRREMFCASLAGRSFLSCRRRLCAAAILFRSKKKAEAPGGTPAAD